ncbi:ABC-three component system middle component 6 [Providencia stuartii]|uniref:Uncharacterized protein n=1 Tax=Providencia alcalifaciens DSM 30120 TaxID=520999 RepID=B6XL24_9GAMM|nr:hypothetical protein PROVALCAL_04086 [Providencia alcalifaciens DSM 30120]SQI34939.1 Uncharacterised protein [Providencia alcalifaciens]
MILPTKLISPIDSLYCISAYVVEILINKKNMAFDDLLDSLNAAYPIPISIEKLQFCLDFLFIIGKLDFENETLKIILE